MHTHTHTQAHLLTHTQIMHGATSEGHGKGCSKNIYFTLSRIHTNTHITHKHTRTHIDYAWDNIGETWQGLPEK